MSDAGSEQTLSEDNNHIINENANTDPNNASFTIDDVVHYGELYDKCVHKNNMNNEIYEKYFHIFANRATKKFSNDVSPYGKKRISWMTLYEKVIRKIISPFNYKNTDKDYVSLHEIENRINIVINNDGVNRRMKTLYTKESGNFIPKIMKMFTYEKNNTAKKEIEKTIENSTAQKKMNYFPFTRRRMTSFKGKSNSSNNLLSILHSFRQDDKSVNKDNSNNNKQNLNNSNNNIGSGGNGNNANTNVNSGLQQQNVSSYASNNDVSSQNRKRVYSLHKFMSVNLDSLQRVYDNHNNTSINAAKQRKRSSFDKNDKTSINASNKDKDKEIKTHLRQTLQPHSSLLKENSLQGIAEAVTSECNNNKNETNTMQQEQQEQQQQSPNTVQQQQSPNTINKDSPINPLPQKHHSPTRHISMTSMPHYKNTNTYRNRTNSSKMLLGSRFNKKISPFTNNPINNNNNNNSSSVVSKENKVPYDPFKIFRQIPKLDYKNYIGNSLYKQMDKLAYKDEISFFKRNTSPIGGSNSLIGGDDQDSNINNIHEKNMNYIFELINFEEENALNNIDAETDVQIRGDRIASYKQMADDIYNILILEGNN